MVVGALLTIELLVEAALWLSLALATMSYIDASSWLLVCMPILMFVGLRAALVWTSYWFAMNIDKTRSTLSFAASLKLVVNETVAITRFCLFIPSENWRLSVNDSELASGDRVVVILLHGVLCNRGIWRPMQRELQSSGVKVLAPNLAPVTAGLEKQAIQFSRWLDGRRIPNTAKVIVVAHSMGGLVARLCIKQALAATSINTLICVGTPHLGSAVARVVPGQVGRDLRYLSPAVLQLANTPDTATNIVNIYSLHDNLVVPSRSAYLASAGRNLVFAGLGHMSMVYSGEVRDSVRRELAAS